MSDKFFQKSGVNLEKLTKLYVIIIVQNQVKQPKGLVKVPKNKLQSMHNSEGDVKTMPAPNYIPLEVKSVCISSPSNL